MKKIYWSLNNIIIIAIIIYESIKFINKQISNIFNESMIVILFFTIISYIRHNIL